ncbi:MAG: endonuclease MutS2 [Erysipelotrichales bacterium]|nr:endonuclease MutS2 [Erysipelotrichales bacterium]
MDNYSVFELDAIKERIAKHANTSMGKELVLEDQVTFEYLRIKRNLERSNDMLQLVIRYGDLPFGGVRDIRMAVKKAKMNAILTPYEIVSVADLLDAARNMLTHVKKLDTKYEALDDLFDSLTTHEKVVLQIRPVFTPSNDIADSASPKLKSIRTNIRKTEASINSQLEKFINQNMSKLMDTVVAYRNDRSVVYVKISEKNSIRGIIHGESTSGQTAYVEPEALIPLNNQLQSLKSQEEEEIERILFELSQLIKDVADDVEADLETFALLDAIHSKALWGKKQNACIPTFTKDNNVFYVKSARHPLIDPLKVVSNTIHIEEGKRVLLITGPNTGGKTVTLKTIGLFTCLAYMGIPLPCDEATIGYYDEIYVDLGDNQSIVESLSTFSAHLSKLAHICDHATKNSLVLIDEFGSGTDPKEGESLAIAILNHLRKLHTTVVATTHYGRLKLYGMKHSDIIMSQVEFDMEKLAPTFRFLQGSTGQSNALDIALRFGIKDGIIRDALNIKNTAMSEEEKLNSKLEQLINENETLNFRLKQELEDERIKNRALNMQLEELEMNKSKMRLKAEQEIAEYIEEKKLEADEILEKLKLQENGKLHERVALKTQLNNLNTDSSDVIQPTTNKREIRVGDFVEIIALGKVGQVESIDKKNEAMVMLHGTKMKVKLDKLRFSHMPSVKVKPKSTATFTRAKHISLECNIIGMRVDEALVVVEKYLDDALLANVPSVRIIHGHGTGALRSAVHDKLKKTKFVESYRLGGGGEGGVGATVVTFKK